MRSRLVVFFVPLFVLITSYAAPIMLKVSTEGDMPLQFVDLAAGIDSGLLFPGQTYTLSDKEYRSVVNTMFDPAVYHMDGSEFYFMCQNYIHRDRIYQFYVYEDSKLHTIGCGSKSFP